MPRRKHTGGGIFTDDLTGAWTNVAKGIFGLMGLIILGFLGIVIYFLVKPTQPSETPDNKGGSTMNKVPGTIKVAEVSQAPSAGQAIIYFSQQQAPGASCGNCTSSFDINLKYYGGKPNPAPVFKTVTANSANGTVTFDYGIPSQTGTPMPIVPAPPTQVNIQITAREVDPSTGKTGAPTSFSKTIAYVGA